MKNLLLLCFLFPFTLIAQDFIIKLNGEEILSKVIEIEPDKIKYKKFDNPDGPLYSIGSNDVFMIKYANGSKDLINSLDQKLAGTTKAKYELTGNWHNKLVPDETMAISYEGLEYHITMNNTKARLIYIDQNKYAVDGISIQLTAISNDSIILKDVGEPGSVGAYLVRVPNNPVAKTTEIKTNKSIIGGGISTGLGASYAGGGINGELRLGTRKFSFRPNIGLGIYSTTLEGTMPISFGAKLYFGNTYVGYRYGYMGSAYIEYYDYYNYQYYTDYADAYGSILVFGYDLNFGKKKTFYLTSGFGVNISGIDLDINFCDFDLGLGVHF